VKAIVPAAALMLMLSCASSTPAPEPEIPVEQVAAAWRKAVCTRVYDCCLPAERMVNPELGKTEAECEGLLDPENSYFLGDIGRSVQEGRVVYHPDKMAACLADLRTRSCELLRAPPGELDVTSRCQGVFEPKVAVGGACTEYWDCVGGWCAGDIGGLQDSCAPRGENGHVCDEGNECLSTICDENNTCVARPAGSGNLCSFGELSEGQHGAPP
jgi:hypothetical protein